MARRPRPPVPRRALARLPRQVRHRARHPHPQEHSRPHPAKVRAPEQADRWVRLLMAAHPQLLLARPPAAGLRRPWEKQPDPARPLAPGRVRPKGSPKGQGPRYVLPGEAGMPRAIKTPLTREKVKT